MTRDEGARRAAPYGTWTSPLSARDVASGALRLSEVVLDGPDVFWLEGRPDEGGRYVLVRQRRDGTVADATPPSINVRSRVHEYGGGAYTVRDGIAYVVNYTDQRVYGIDCGDTTGSSAPAPRALTPAGPWRYADLVLDAPRRRLICVREDHTAGSAEPVNAIAAIDCRPPDEPSEARVLASGDDFYASPRLNPDSSMLAWLSWRHPSMPWDETELWIAHIDDAGELKSPRRMAGGNGESIYQPGWASDGSLYFVSDRTGWWRICRLQQGAGQDESNWAIQPVLQQPPARAEFGRPQWVFGTSTWTSAGSSRLAVSYTRDGRWYLGTIDLRSGVLSDLAPDVQPGEWMAADDTRAILVAGFDDRPDAVVDIDLSTGAVKVVRSASAVEMDASSVSVAEAIEFPTTHGRTAHAFYYAPRNPAFTAAPDERPPLILVSHGGPTTAARSTFHPSVQYWTSRGFAVADVNYSGSSGYGRAYRERLRGSWGIVDVDDMVSAAEYLTAECRADRHRLIIRGGSAGGYTALAALAFRPGVFAAGASYYGICDLELLARDTHKFESRYLDGLVGPYPEAAATYRARSPLHACDRLESALILFQGLEDVVVPPSQSELMADAVRRKGLPVACLAFEGEQHGFRRRDTIVRCLEAELYFYSRVFRFVAVEQLPSVHVDNADF